MFKFYPRIRTQPAQLCFNRVGAVRIVSKQDNLLGIQFPNNALDWFDFVPNGCNEHELSNHDVGILLSVRKQCEEFTQETGESSQEARAR